MWALKSLLIRLSSLPCLHSTMTDICAPGLRIIQRKKPCRVLTYDITHESMREWWRPLTTKSSSIEDYNVWLAKGFHEAEGQVKSLCRLYKMEDNFYLSWVVVFYVYTLVIIGLPPVPCEIYEFYPISYVLYSTENATSTFPQYAVWWSVIKYTIQSQKFSLLIQYFAPVL